MKLDFPISKDGYHQYCMHCHEEKIERTYKDGNTFYLCKNCGKTSDRSIVIDPSIKWWIDKDKTYWHESAGVFVLDKDNNILLFKRTIFPFSLTIPAGHVDKDEDPLDSAVRELVEETGLVTTRKQLRKIVDENISGDSCRRGCDDHKWHAYILKLDNQPKIKIREEGKNPVWKTVAELLNEEDLIYPVKYILKKYEYELTRI